MKLITSRLVTALFAFTSASFCLAQQPVGDISVALTGDTNLHRKLSVLTDPGFLKVRERIQTADIAFTNVEQAIHNFQFSGAATITSPNSQSPLWTPEEIKWMGFDVVAVANNHTFDYGVDGLRNTLKALDAVGLPHAGAGENLAFAQAPTYVESKQGRIALISTTSTFIPEAPAGEQRPDIKGRPGLSVLRYKTTYIVSPATLNDLKELKNLDGRLRGAYTAYETGFSFGGAEVKVGDKLDVLTEADPYDLKQLLAQVREARLNADIVIVSIHAHERGHGDLEKPANFLVQFAHAAIDAGADIFTGQGPLILKGIEIYKNKPIFYSLGNFVNNKLGSTPFLAAEAFKAQGLPPTSTAGEWGEAHESGESYTKSAGESYWQSVVATTDFGPDHKLKAVTLYPIALGEGGEQRGTPRVASSATAKIIYERLVKLSSPFGTSMTFNPKDGSIRVAVQPAS